MDKRIGIIGLGQMGGGMARNLVRAGLNVTGCDIDEGARKRLADAGGRVTDDAAALVRESDLIATSLTAPVMKGVLDRAIRPNLRSGQIHLDHSTMSAPVSRALAAEFKERGVTFVDAPVSGGSNGAEAGELRIFLGCDEATRQPLEPYFRAVGNPDQIFTGGEPGMGQVMKAVQNMSGWYTEVIYFEVIAYGLRSGLSLDQVAAVAGGPGKPGIERAKRYIENDNEWRQSVITAEWPYFLDECKASGYGLPIMSHLQEYLEREPMDAVDNVHRPCHNVWKRFLRDQGGKADDPGANPAP